MDYLTWIMKMTFYFMCFRFAYNGVELFLVFNTKSFLFDF